MTFWDEFFSEALSFLRHISPALVGVVLGGFILQRFFVSRSNEASLIDFLIKALDELRADSLEYWNLDAATDESRARVLEQKLKGAIKSLTGDLKYYGGRYCRKIDFDILMADVADACTGGTFETKKRKPDSGRYLVIINAVNRVKSQLMRRKI